MTIPSIDRLVRAIEAASTHNVLDQEYVGLLKVSDTTPSVLNLTKFMAVNTGAVNVTYFDDGFDGQEISILGDGQTTVKYDATKIMTNTAADKLLATGKVYRFTRYAIGANHVWVEDA